MAGINPGHITHVGFERLFTRENYKDNAKVSAEADVAPDEDPELVLAEVIRFVNRAGARYLQDGH
jgi:hypothetical protein